jgi:hypothetical protein
MAGSLRNFQYTDDADNIYLFKADESNTEAVNGTEANIESGNVNNPGLPRSLKPRRVYYSNADRTRTISVIAATLDVYNEPPDGITDPIAGSGTLTLVRKRPEVSRLYPNVDTGLTDGDAPL